MNVMLDFTKVEEYYSTEHIRTANNVTKEIKRVLPSESQLSGNAGTVDGSLTEIRFLKS